MEIRALGWAGFEMRCEDEGVLVDAVVDAGVMAAWQTGPPFLEPTGPVQAALVTHLHRDHTDVALLDRALSGARVVAAPPASTGTGLVSVGVDEAEHALAATDLDLRRCLPGDELALGGFRVTAVPSMDWAGDPQIAWVLEAGGVRVLHAGDTMWHGGWWAIARDHGPFDAVLLPVNGVRVALPHRTPPVDVPAVMGPEEAVAAAAILGARRLVPTHFGAFAHPVHYRERDDVLDALATAADRADVAVVRLAPGETLTLA
jgi:L-ascorbate metabolism protein UlaG (beta-lactamase superfamily)